MIFLALLLLVAPCMAGETSSETVSEEVSNSITEQCGYYAASPSMLSASYLQIRIANAGLGRPNSIIVTFPSSGAMGGTIPPSGYYNFTGSFTGRIYVSFDVANNKIYMYPTNDWNPEGVSGWGALYVQLPPGLTMSCLPGTGTPSLSPASGITVYPADSMSFGRKYPATRYPSVTATWSYIWSNTVSCEHLEGDTYNISVTKNGFPSTVETRGSITDVYHDILQIQASSSADTYVESNFGPFRVFVKSPNDNYHVVDFSVPGMYYPSIQNDYVLAVDPRSAAVGESISAELTTPTGADVSYVSWLVDGAMSSSYALNGSSWYEYDSFTGTFSHAVFDSDVMIQTLSFATEGTHRISCRIYNPDLEEEASLSATVTISGEYSGDGTVSGYVYDLVTGSSVAGATVTASQVSVGNTVSTTSDSSGYFSLSGLKTNSPVTFTTSATGYDTRTIRYTSVPQQSTWAVDMYIYPTGEISGVSLYGQLYSAGSMQGISGATVTVSNSTYSDSDITSSSGYFEFSDLASGSYSISTSATGHATLTESVAVAATATQHNIALDENCALTVSVKDADGSGIIADRIVTVSLSNGRETTTSSGIANFTVDYGSYTVTASADGYLPISQYVFCDSGSTMSQIFMTNSSTSSTPQQSYTPKQVRFTFLLGDSGAVIPGLSVSAVGTNTTAGSLDWFKSLFGMEVSTAENVSTTRMSGITGSDGSIAFMMLDATYYQINVTSADLDINTSLNLYPREEEYVFTIWSALPSAATRVTWDFGTSDVDETHTALGISYRDRGNRTQSFTFNVYDENRTLLHSDTLTDDYDISVSHTVENDPGKVMYWGFNATLNGTNGQPEYVKADQYIRFEDSTPFAFGLPDVIRYWVGFLFLICIGAMFGYISLKFAGPIIGIFALTLKFMDWLPIGWEMAIIMFVLGCLSYIRFTKDDRGV